MEKPSINEDSITLEFTISASASQAFNIFTQQLDSWWPKAYTWAGESLEEIVIESVKNGRCYERGPHAFECDWGRVLTWEPPNRLMFTWQIDPDRVPQPNPDKASEIEILFEEENESTQITFIHRNFVKHGENAKEYKQALASEEGWPLILSNYEKAVSKK